MYFSYAMKYTCMNEISNYRLWEHIQKITWFHVLLANKNLSFTDDTSQQPCQANKQWSSLKVAIQASGYSKLLYAW